MIVQKFQTSDGQLFDQESAAREHELRVGYLSDIERILKKSLPGVSATETFNTRLGLLPSLCGTRWKKLIGGMLACEM